MPHCPLERRAGGGGVAVVAAGAVAVMDQGLWRYRRVAHRAVILLPSPMMPSSTQRRRMPRKVLHQIYLQNIWKFRRWKCRRPLLSRACRRAPPRRGRPPTYLRRSSAGPPCPVCPACREDSTPLLVPCAPAVCRLAKANCGNNSGPARARSGRCRQPIRTRNPHQMCRHNPNRPLDRPALLTCLRHPVKQ